MRSRPLGLIVIVSIVLGLVATQAVALLEAADLSGPCHPIVSSTPESGDQPVGGRHPKSGLLYVVDSDVRPDIGVTSHGSPAMRLWLEVEVQKPLVSSRLQFCSEFTKPDSSCIRLMGTPKNHRSPPA
jgi:hypothetical protein